MSIACVVCGEWYHQSGKDTLDICAPCFAANFAALAPAQPPVPEPPSARAALEAYVTAPVTERQRRAMARLVERWAAEAQP